MLTERTYRVASLLRHYQELQQVALAEPGTELAQVRLDLEAALVNTPLSDAERVVIGGLFMSNLTAPERTDAGGRPRGASTLSHLLLNDNRSDNARNLYVSRVLNRACAKMAAYLGDGYEA